MSARATILKEEGNKLYAQKDYKAALAKYSASIALDETNAVLWANRSACQLSLKQYLDACGDAFRAIEIDPAYYKAHARLATAQDALEEYMLSTMSWKAALDAMPQNCLTEFQRGQRAEYKKNMKNALMRREAKNQLRFTGPLHRSYGDNESGFPWDIAAGMVSDLRKRKVSKSCVRFFCVGMASGRRLKVVGRGRPTHALSSTQSRRDSVPSIRLQVPIEGEEGAFALITDAILREPRVWHLIHVQEWIDAYNLCGTLERQHHNPWIGVGFETVQREAPGRLAERGWSEVRTDIELTIRFWLIRDRLEGTPRTRVAYATQVINLIEWGREAYPDVSLEVKGKVFGRHFLRAARSHLLDTLLEAYCASQRQRDDEVEFLVPLLRHADTVLKDLETDPRPSEVSWKDDEYDPGYYLSLFEYPKGNALSCKAFFHSCLGTRENATQREKSRNNHKASQLYMQAAGCYPRDDEKHSMYLNCATQHGMQFPGMTAKDVIAITTRIKETYPLASKIWRVHPSRIKAEGQESHERMMNIDKDIGDWLAAGGNPECLLVKQGPDMSDNDWRTLQKLGLVDGFKGQS